MSKRLLLTGLGLILIFLSLGTRVWVTGAEREARRLGQEQLKTLERLSKTDTEEHKEATSSESPPTKEDQNEFRHLNRIFLKDTTLDANIKTINEQPDQSWVLVVSDPPGAQMVKQEPYGPTSSVTPTLVRRKVDKLELDTTFRYGVFEPDQYMTRRVNLRFKIRFYVLFSLIVPGLLFLGLGLYPQEPNKEPKAPSDSGVTIVRPPLPLENSGPVRHDPDTPQELIFGDFVQGEHLGKGNMGTVYRCRSGNAADQRAYALKVLLPEWSDSVDFRKRFEREAAICQKLDHPNLVRAYESGEKDGRLWLVMDYIAGGELKDWLAQSSRSVDEMITLFQQICSGLEHAHKHDVVHRDLKPDNILITEDNKAVIADFGLARGKHYETITKTNTTLGTPIYMPPEQIVGGTGSPRGDLYGLGCILYEMLAGRPPFEQTDVLVLLQDKLNGKLPPPLENVPTELNDIVFKLLAYTPEDRFQSASELSEALSSMS